MCGKIWRLIKKSYLCTPFEKRVCRKGKSSLKSWQENKISKIFEKKFGSLKIMPTFAAPFEKRVLERGFGSSLKRLFYCTRSKYREKQFIEKR